MKFLFVTQLLLPAATVKNTNLFKATCSAPSQYLRLGVFSFTDPSTCTNSFIITKRIISTRKVSFKS